MGIKDVTTNINTPAFETEDHTMTTTADNAAASASVAASTAVAKAAAGAAVASRPKAKFEMAFADLQWAFPEDAVVGLSLAVPRIKAEQGAAYVGEKSIGDKFKIEIESWNPRTLISAGLSSNDAGYQESMEYLRTSYDGVTLHGEETTVDEYLNYLRNDLGYSKAKSSKYIDLFGFITWTAKDGDIAQEKRDLSLVQLSQTSAGNFAAFCTTQGLMRSKGLVKGDSNIIEVRAEARSKGTMKYSNFSFSVA